VRIAPKADYVAVWLRRLASYHEHQPDAAHIHLSHFNPTSVWDDYIVEAEAGMHAFVSFAHFRMVWKRDCPDIKVRKHQRFSVCSVCDKWREDMRSEKDHAERQLLAMTLKVHLREMRLERAQYHSRRERARLEPAKYLSMIIDGADQGRYKIPYLVTKVLLSASSYSNGHLLFLCAYSFFSLCSPRTWTAV